MSRLKSFPLLALLSLPIGCTQFHTGRSFISEMENDDSRFFGPGIDFPVVAGDSGRDWSTDREMRARTPATEEERAENQYKKSLRQELLTLEQLQSEESFNFYEKHKHQLSTISEKIYFLKLPPHERREYLLARGFIDESKISTFLQSERMLADRKQDILLGMTKNDVMESWGKPVRVDIAGNPRNENERWLYKMNGASKYIYFESGSVQGWE
jgi:hypothetical protein